MNWLKNKNKEDTRRLVADKIVKNPDGTMDVTITFNPFEHGHFLGKPRNYAIDKYKKMVENPKTQLHIKNGYAIGTYTHDYRADNGILKSRDENGNPIEPCCKTIAMEWVEPNYVRHTQRIANNETGKKIQKLIEAGIGGFSSVHNLNTGDFYGFDYVIYPNFTTNRVVADNSCERGMCSLNLDAVLTELEDEINKKAEFVADALGLEDDERESVIQVLKELEKETPEYKKEVQLAKEIEKAKLTLQDNFKQKESLLNNKIKELKQILKEKEEKINSLEREKKQIEKDKLQLENNLLKKENILNRWKMELDSLDLEVIDGHIKPKENFLDNIFQKGDLERELQIQFDESELIKIRKPKTLDEKISKIKGIW